MHHLFQVHGWVVVCNAIMFKHRKRDEFEGVLGRPYLLQTLLQVALSSAAVVDETMVARPRHARVRPAVRCVL
jgi:hypothetical protein